MVKLIVWSTGLGITGNKNSIKKKMKNILFYIIIASLFILSCQKILFNDEVNTREIALNDFHEVRFYGIYNIVLIQDSTNRLVITGQNDINSIDAVSKDGMLIIDNHKKMPFNPNKNTLTLHFTNLDYMSTWDPVNISNRDTLKTDHFLYDAVGEIAEVRLTVDCNNFKIENYTNTLGYFYINGKANNCTFINSYGCSIFADSLFCKSAEIVNVSVGDVHVNASESIKVSINGPGNICYYGSPVIEIAERRGNGKLIQLQ
ncbi:MAG TPA: DUF2807 domain-containing protein [Bacteroidales bacterium]|nr:DUF2807 domain-containing protein [Bacteroidales bacterium]